MISGRLVLCVVVVLGILGTPFAVAAQGAKFGKPARIGRLSPNSAENDAPNLEAFRKGCAISAGLRGRTSPLRLGSQRANRSGSPSLRRSSCASAWI
jgi:hypothetical protein